MATGTEVSTSQATTTTLASAKAFMLAHPIGVAVVGGALVGAGAYFLMGKFFKKKEPVTPTEA